MKISKVRFRNFRIYNGENEVIFSPSTDASKNISIIAGRNGFGKTTFLTSLIWVFYGKMMGEVEEKYRKDIKNAGGYDKFLKTLLNRDVKAEYEQTHTISPVFLVEIELKDLLIPSIPCKSVRIKRSYDLRTEKEELQIFIDGLENELTKEVGFEVFINDFILPREIAKFFFFDAEKIVSLAEAKTKIELKNLSRAYSEVLGIKKYEELKKNLETLLTKLRRNNASPLQQNRLNELINKERELTELIEHNTERQADIDREIQNLKTVVDNLQEKLIREGNEISIGQLKEMKKERDDLKLKSQEIRNKLKKLLDLAPLVMAGKKLAALHSQLVYEHKSHGAVIDRMTLVGELNQFSAAVLEELEAIKLDGAVRSRVEKVLEQIIDKHQEKEEANRKQKVLLDFTDEQFRNFEALYAHIKSTFSEHFEEVVQEEKTNKVLLTRILYKLKQVEARKDNPLAQKVRKDKLQADERVESLQEQKNKLIEELGALKNEFASNAKVLSEYEKNFNLAEADQKKYDVTEELLTKINAIIKKIKEDKKYALQKSIMLGLKRIMHKDNFIHEVRVNVMEDVMDIDLLDKNGNVIDKDGLSKGEQQLYATALLKALVDESGIRFPVFIDSPLQKFDKHHSKKIIKEFYPAISEQVVLFPLLEKELSELEYEYLMPNLNSVFLIENDETGSRFRSFQPDRLFEHFKQETDVHAN